MNNLMADIVGNLILCLNRNTQIFSFMTHPLKTLLDKIVS
ncbi:MAG: hypothetical protein BWY72_02447 [Bacteroidetes bacterium ADurb.Bin416]|nr:MAG: hypothetical protein BWY72_02447 [Bacteroidetes bacterium ADurb.Bin416]